MRRLLGKLIQYNLDKVLLYLDFIEITYNELLLSSESSQAYFQASTNDSSQIKYIQNTNTHLFFWYHKILNYW